MEFYGLCQETRLKGFATQRAVFDWVAEARFFDPRRLTDPTSGRNQRKDRTMYQSFLEYAHDMSVSSAYANKASGLSPEAVIEEAKVFFGQKAEYDAIV